MKTRLVQLLCFGILVWLTLTAKATVLTEAQKPSAEVFQSMRYGLFTHMVYNRTISPDGSHSHKSLDEFANGIDVKAYAEQVKSIGVEYVIFTAWHFAMYNLGPNAALEKWLPGHTAKRDVIGELADALNERGIKLIIYAHPNDGHDLKKEEQERVGFIQPKPRVSQLMPKFNDFINEVYAELAVRYSKKPNVLGFWWDSWYANGGAIDMPRLRQTLLQAMPRAIVLSNSFNPEYIDYSSLERRFRSQTGDIDSLIVETENQTATFAGKWWCENLKAHSLYSVETLFKFTVLNACSGAPGGMCWAVSPSSDGKTWASDNLQTMLKLNSYIQGIRPSLCGVARSANWSVNKGCTFSKFRGYGATRSLDGTREYVHILKAPEGKPIDLEPASEVFKSARLLSNGHPVKMEPLAQGLRLTLVDADQWDPLDTVIVLERDPTPGPRPIH